MDQRRANEASLAPPATKRINLNVLSPSTNEVPGGKLTFSGCPTTTTIAELKLRICNALETKPAPERQRLIYRGRPLIQDSATLNDVFSHDEITDSSEHSLHLVLPPSAPSQPREPSSSQSHSSVQRPPHQHPPGPIPTPPPGQRGQPHLHFAPPPIPPHIQQAINSHIQSVTQQLVGQVVTQAGHAGHTHFGAMQAHGPHQLPQQSFQQVLAQQQQARAAAGQQGVGGQTLNPAAQGSTLTPGQDSSTGGQSNGLPRASTPVNVNTVVRENHGSNGETWRMVIQSTSTVTAQNPHAPRVPTPVNVGMGLPGVPHGAFAGPHPPHGPPLTQGQLQSRIFESELMSIQHSLARGTAPAPQVFDNARALLRNAESTEGEHRLRSHLERLSIQADHMRGEMNRMLLRAVSEQPIPIPTQQGVTNQSPPPSSGESSVYLLSSPNGPQALLVSPWGNYSAPWQFPPLTGTSSPLSLQHIQPQPMPSIPSTNANEMAPQNPQTIPAQNPEGQPQLQPQQLQQNQQANEARDLLRLLIPLGGHIWLLIRLFGFVYFFTAGGGSRRTFILGAFAFLVFMAQTGIFRPFVQAVWDPLRRHVEGLLPLPGQEPAQDPAPGGDQRIARGPTPNSRTERQNQQPTPQEAATRLLQERERRDTSVLREQIRRIERAAALFIGSLVPGFGERHIAARDAAEAARVAEQRRREEAARREEEGRHAQASGVEASGTSGRTQEDGGAPDSAGHSQGESQPAQAPLVEI